jgi:hypothetical protein
VPVPTSRGEWLRIGRALITEMRHQFAIPDGLQTIAIGWTDVPGLTAHRFVGASREIRAVTVLPTPSMHIVTPRTNQQFQDHAEQDVVNGFVDEVGRLGADLSREDGPNLWIFVSQDVCSACRQGDAGSQVMPGVLMQLSLRHANLMVSVGWEDLAGDFGHLAFLAGERIRT